MNISFIGSLMANLCYVDFSYLELDLLTLRLRRTNTRQPLPSFPPSPSSSFAARTNGGRSLISCPKRTCEYKRMRGSGGRGMWQRRFPQSMSLLGTGSIRSWCAMIYAALMTMPVRALSGRSCPLGDGWTVAREWIWEVRMRLGWNERMFP